MNTFDLSAKRIAYAVMYNDNLFVQYSSDGYCYTPNPSTVLIATIDEALNILNHCELRNPDGKFKIIKYEQTYSMLSYVKKTNFTHLIEKNSSTIRNILKSSIVSDDFFIEKLLSRDDRYIVFCFFATNNASRNWSEILILFKKYIDKQFNTTPINISKHNKQMQINAVYGFSTSTNYESIIMLKLLSDFDIKLIIFDVENSKVIE